MRGQPQGLPHLRMRLHLRFDRLFSEANYHPRIHSIATIASCRYRFAPVCYYYTAPDVQCQVHKAVGRCVTCASHCYNHGANPVVTYPTALYEYYTTVLCPRQVFVIEAKVARFRCFHCVEPESAKVERCLHYHYLRVEPLEAATAEW